MSQNETLELTKKIEIYEKQHKGQKMQYKTISFVSASAERSKKPHRALVKKDERTSRAQHENIQKTTN